MPSFAQRIASVFRSSLPQPGSRRRSTGTVAHRSILPLQPKPKHFRRRSLYLHDNSTPLSLLSTSSSVTVAVTPSTASPGTSRSASPLPVVFPRKLFYESQPNESTGLEKEGALQSSTLSTQESVYMGIGGEPLALPTPDTDRL